MSNPQKPARAAKSPVATPLVPSAEEAAALLPQLKFMTIAELLQRRFEGNPKTHAVPAIAASMRRFGFTVPLIVDAITGGLSAGHGRLKGAVELKAAWDLIQEPTPAQVKQGWLGRGKAPVGIMVTPDGQWALPVIPHTFASEAERDAYVIADNRIPESGGWDMDALRKLLIRSDTTQLDSIGFSAESFNRMLQGFALPVDGSTKRGRKARSGTGLTYKVIVTCRDEQDHARLMDRLEGEGYTVAPLIS